MGAVLRPPVDSALPAGSRPQRSIKPLTTKHLVISIHDVAPDTFDDVRYLVDQLDAVNARPRVFKVIPQHLEASHDLIRFLQAQQKEGSEIVMHGYSHRRSGPWQGPWGRRLRAQLFAPQDAEFLSLTAPEIESRLTIGRAILLGAGLNVQGFSAPGWIESSDVLPALRRLGFQYDVRMTQLIDLTSGRRTWTDWIGYMGAGGLQESLVGIANQVNRAAMPLFSCSKLFLHPKGARTSSASRAILNRIPRLIADRTIATYGSLLNQA